MPPGILESMRGVADPAGQRWTVRRRWFPWRLRWRGATDLDVGPLDLLDLGEIPVIGAVIGIILLLLVTIFIGLPLVFLLVELCVGLVALVGALFGRVVLRRPWQVEAIPRGMGPQDVRLWNVVGFRASGRLKRQIRDALTAGASLPPDSYGLPTGRDGPRRRGRA